eukprot:scaffold5069_cov126-Skeletonema_menzelii.AAC.8
MKQKELLVITPSTTYPAVVLTATAISITDSASTAGNEGTKASISSVNAALQTSCSEDSTAFDLLPNTILHTKARIH